MKPTSDLRTPTDVMLRIRVYNATKGAMRDTLGDVEHYLPPDAVDLLLTAVADRVVAAVAPLEDQDEPDEPEPQRTGGWDPFAPARWPDRAVELWAGLISYFTRRFT